MNESSLLNSNVDANLDSGATGNANHADSASQSARSLPESNGTISVGGKVGRLKKFLAFAGPGYLISVGYMDPGNWATDLAGGAKFGYALVWVILVSNLMAMLLQTLCARLGIATGKDLAQACRDYYPKPVALALWFLCEIAIIACDLAEVIGSAVALKLLFGLDLMWGVLITGFDVLILLGALRFGFRKLEAIVITLVATIAFCFAVQIFFARPDWSGVARGAFFPSMPNQQAFALALGILGATVMPHNLYLHSSIVQTRALGNSVPEKREAIKYNTLDTVIALGLAFFVNAAILVVAAAVFHAKGQFEVAELEEAYKLLGPSVAAPIASTMFAVALLASGQSSTITGTLAGQIVMEGFLKIRIKPWLRRLITRGLAIIPAMLLIHATGGKQTTNLLILSQIVLSMQLPFAIFPLVMFTSDKKKMGEFANPLSIQILGYAVATIIASLNVYLLFQTARDLIAPHL
ncbi:manganese transport protein [Abditibacterium utsteinense]|uniref:Divalent metal cation transporter MntH n=1 Tax=Abditibacterium utsteinense TaxID=1960156 RepID=A0A2S8SPZ7_9BACT|nr:Nramp family divalent metal transporter [Abditibacterium utsteinense]PQV62868.1 manganese transport protein [Abditibacterium utsteinense]